MEMTSLIIVGVVAIIGILSRYRKCKSDELLVVYGKTGSHKEKVSERDAKGNLVDREVEIKTAKVYHGGAAFVWPIIQGYEVMSMQPIQLNLVLKNALSAQNIRVTIPTTVTVAISQEPLIMQNAVKSVAILEAEAEAKANATKMQLEAEAEGTKKKLLAEGKKASLMAEAEQKQAMEMAPALAVEHMIKSGMHPEAIVQYAMTDRWKEVAEANAKVFEHIQLGNVTVYGDSNTAGQFMANMAKNLAPSLEIARNLPIADSLKQIITGKKPEESPAKGDNLPPVK